MGIAAEFFEILGQINTLNSLVQTLLGGQTQLATASQLNTVFQQMLAQFAIVQVQTQQNDLLIQSALAKLNSLQLNLQAQIGDPQQTNEPVTLPANPPPAYGGGSPSDTAIAVWAYQPVDSGRYPEAQDILAKLDNLTSGLDGFLGLPTTGGGPFRSSFNLNPRANLPWSNPPSANPASILPTDADIGAWLGRVTSFTWTLDSDNQFWYAFEPFSNGAFYYCTLSAEEFAWYQQGGPLPGAASGAPVWPGLANVTLLPAHTMAPPGEDITIDCDGVIIDITGVPSWAGKFQFGGATSWRNVGAVTFTTDNGQAEYAQTFSWNSGVYMPKTQAHAAGYAYRASLGVSGTITPFTID